MRSEWQLSTLAEVVQLQRGHDLPATVRGNGSIPVIGSSGVTGHHDEAKYGAPGVAIGRSGASIGVASYVDEPFWPLNTCLFVRDFKGNDPRWVYYLLDSIDFSGYNSGSAQPSLNRNYLAQIPVLLPPVAEQRAIAATLGVLDDKIESNRRITSQAMELALAHFEQVSSEMSTVPLGDTATLVLGGTPSRKREDFWAEGTIPWIASGAANQDIVMEPTEYITEAALSSSAAKLMPEGATVVAITGATLGQVALLGIPTSGNQSLVGVWGESPALTAWLHFAVRSSIGDLLKSATGAAQQHVNKGDVASLRVPMPTSEQLEEWAAVCLPLVKTAVSKLSEAIKLRMTRDMLLPELLSGRICGTFEELVSA